MEKQLPDSVENAITATTAAFLNWFNIEYKYNDQPSVDDLLREFAEHITADQVTGARWVKASERLPEIDKNTGTSDVMHIKKDNNGKGVGVFVQEGGKAYLMGEEKAHRDLSKIFWLDESPLPSTKGEGSPKLDIRDAAILENAIEVLNWMMKTHSVDDKSLQSDSFNRPANAITGLEYMLEREIKNEAPTPLPTLQEQAVKDLAAKYATDNVSDVSKWTPQIQLKYNAFLAGHAQSSGEVEALRSKLKVATDVLTDIKGRYEKGEMAHMLASDGLKQIQEK